MSHGVKSILAAEYESAGGKLTKQQIAAMSLRHAIMAGEIEPDGWIDPNDWAERLSMSPTPVREALRELEAQGLVRITPHRGAQALSYSMKDLRDVHTIRGVLESMVTEWATERRAGDATWLASLEKLNTQFRAECERGEPSMRETNRRFHMLVYSGADSAQATQVITSMWKAFQWDTLLLAPERRRAAADDHDAILSAMRRGDARLAGQIMRDHIAAASSALIRLIETGEQS